MHMRYRSLGRTGIEVSELGLGTYPLGGALQTSGSYWAGPATYGAVARDEALATIRAAIEHGVTFIDTAPVYGEAEAFIGAALHDRPSEVPERRCYVATKCGEHVRPVDGGVPVLARDFTQAALGESIKRSRARLGVDRIDLVLLHSPGPEEFAENPLGLLADARERGEIAHIGVSARSVEHAIELIERDGRAEVIQVGFNLLEPAAAYHLFPLASQCGVGIVARVPLASGFLTGRIGEDHVFAPDDYRSTMSRAQIVRRARQAASFQWLVDEGIARELSEAAIRFVLSFPAVSTVIAGVMRREEILVNVSAVDAGPLPADALERIRRQQDG
jgi:aryl-alcohol dehydrogenase-like predicted oxidoreductase